MKYMQTVVRFRKSLLQLVRLREIDYVFDGLLEHVKELTNEGVDNALFNKNLWSDYLSPVEAAVDHDDQSSCGSDEDSVVI